MKIRPLTNSDPSTASRALIAALALVAASGCMTPPDKSGEQVTIPDDVQHEADREFVREPIQDQIRQGVLRQRTIFAYQFQPDSASLTTVGRRNLKILAESMTSTSGRVGVERGDAAPALYSARLGEVRRQLQSLGIAPDRIELADTASGGTGVNSADALYIRERIRRAPMPPPSDGDVLSPFGGSGGSMGAGGTP
ncbi:MAG: hypothetical protein RLZZ558_1982 [Planctomycetota bacterium]|jgi:hypothetical protein